eukprot:scaffold26433_cov176-Cylindrotheca_fusiformis.AAC.1
MREKGDIGNRRGGEAGSVVGHAVEVTRDVVAELGVAVETLVECHQAQDGGSGGGSSDQALAIPVEGGQVVGTGLDGAFPNVETVGSHGVVQKTTQQFELGVIESSLGVVKADEGRRNVGGEGTAPKNRARGAIAAANGAACTVENSEASGNEFGEPSGSGAKVGMQPTEVIEGCMKTGMQAKTGLSFTGSDGGLEVTEETSGAWESQ